MFTAEASKSPCDFVLFGGLGDLSCRKLIPALYQLERADLLHSETRIICCDRQSLTLSAFLELLKIKTQQLILDEMEESQWQCLTSRIVYCQLELNQPEDYQKLTALIKPNEKTAIFYLAIPPFLYAKACQGLSRFHLNNQKSRVVLEKPIGENLSSSIVINDEVGRFFVEDQIYRIDHYLGKETVLNLLVLRFANPVFSLNWDHRIIEKIEITVAEEIGVEGRWEYYDKAGQVRDMLQNHLLQILSLVAMEPPISLSAENLRSEKLKALKSLRMINESNVNEYTLRAQYAGNEIKGKKMAGYQDEGTYPLSATETFVAIKAFVDNWRWSGVPFYLQTGKRLRKKQSEVVIYFKSLAHNIFHQNNKELLPNQLIIRLQPDEGVELRIMNKIPGLGDHIFLKDSKLDLNFNHSFNSERVVDAYERLLLEVMFGNQYLFVSRDEIEQAWKWIDGIKDAWEHANVPLYTYPSGTWGPEQVMHLFNGHSHVWNENHANS